jgi:alpha-N-arabinofuranosidase
MKQKVLFFASFIILSCFFSGAQQNNKIVVAGDQGKYTISKHIYGHFSEHLGRCIYGGIWVGEDSPIPNTRGIRNDVVKALKDLQIPNLRWPGGCFADEYHWQDGIGPRNKRPKMINTHWGGVVEDNSFGTHEFLDLCEQLECEPYICGNVGSGTVEEMSKWIEYMTFDGESPMANLRKQNGRKKPCKIKFFGVGNENWGCGGDMYPDYYADLYRRYAVYCRNYGENRLYKIAGGPNIADYNWTETLMKKAKDKMNALSLHYYTIPTGNWGNKGSATDFDEALYFNTINNAYFMKELVEKHSAIMDKYDPEKRVALAPDEWGAWYNVEPGTNPGFLYQQNTMRDAIIAAVTLDIFNHNCDRVRIANIAQMVNVLQAIILTDNEKMLLTPTYWVFDLYKVHQDATMLPVSVTSEKYSLNGKSIDAVSASASRDASGKIHITLTNIDPNKPQSISCELNGITGKNITGKILTSNKINDHNTFEKPNTVELKEFKNAKIDKGTLTINLPSKSVVMLEIE